MAGQHPVSSFQNNNPAAASIIRAAADGLRNRKLVNPAVRRRDLLEKYQKTTPDHFVEDQIERFVTDRAG